jgi:hypothetical protein
MKISLTERGGWSAGISPTAQTLDFSNLDENSAREGRKFVEQLMRHSPAPSDEHQHARDDMEFTIRVEDSGGDSREFTMNSMVLTREFADLLNWLKQQLREKRHD